MIGFIGLGNMGHHMARNLIKKGHQLVVYDINKQIVNDLAKSGKFINIADFELLDFQHIIIP